MNGMFNLEGKVAIVTGGNGGIGKGIARGFAAAGSDIVIVARDQEKTDEAASEIQADFGVRMLGLQRDLREENQIQGMIEPVVKEFGRIDILVNAILPGWIDTDLIRRARKDIAGLHERVLDRTPT
ncbi:MAG: SDR family NAD(P)-dependent oxidoreductase, partial [Desulfobacterales bacterium]